MTNRAACVNDSQVCKLRPQLDVTSPRLLDEAALHEEEEEGVTAAGNTGLDLMVGLRAIADGRATTTA